MRERGIVESRQSQRERQRSRREMDHQGKRREESEGKPCEA